ncbi:hypothetical protein IFM89_007835, partial [Coptis chinensis]
PMRLIQVVVPHMVTRKKGKIVNSGSVGALAPGPWAGAYIASKVAFHSLIDSLSLSLQSFSRKMIYILRLSESELRTFGIDVITVVPGAIRTNIANTSTTSYERMPEWKLYKPFNDVIHSRTTLLHTMKPITPEEFAKKNY